MFQRQTIDILDLFLQYLVQKAVDVGEIDLLMHKK